MFFRDKCFLCEKHPVDKNSAILQYSTLDGAFEKKICDECEEILNDNAGPDEEENESI